MLGLVLAGLAVRFIRSVGILVVAAAAGQFLDVRAAVALVLEASAKPCREEHGKCGNQS